VSFDAPTVIRTKRDGGRLSDAAIDWVVDAYTRGQVADEQMAALLMAIFWRGMDRGEIARLELLVKKLQTELQIERQYTQALELQIHAFTQTE